MSTTIEIQDARDRLPELVLEAERGEGVVLTEAGVLVARLEAIPQLKFAPRIHGLQAGTVPMSDDFSDPLPCEFCPTFSQEAIRSQPLSDLTRREYRTIV